jgi:hypothetical protein
MKKGILILSTLFIIGCTQNNEILNKKMDSINFQLKTIYYLLDSTRIVKQDLLKDSNYNVLIWKKTK